MLQTPDPVQDEAQMLRALNVWSRYMNEPGTVDLWDYLAPDASYLSKHHNITGAGYISALFDGLTEIALKNGQRAYTSYVGHLYVRDKSRRLCVYSLQNKNKSIGSVTQIVLSSAGEIQQILLVPGNFYVPYLDGVRPH